MEILTNNNLKLIKQLKQKKFRDKEQLFVIEGEKIIQEAIQRSPDSIREIVITSKLEDEEWLEGYPSKLATTKQMGQLSSLKTPPRAIAVLDFISNRYTSDLILVVDGVQNPGNFGTILRTAAWFGCYQIVASENTVDLYNPKVIQATMGSIFDVSVTYEVLPLFLKNVSIPIYGADMNGERIYTLEKPSKAVLVMGSEGKGISPQVQKLLTKKIAIPKIGKGESLNVAMASGIILSEFTCAV